MTPEVLVVDDDRGMRLLLRTILARQGFKVIEAADGQKAVDQVFVSPPDLILMDVMMPTMDGLTACRIIRNTRSTAHIPIILVSALGSQEDEKKGMNSGADRYLKKPISPTALVDAMNEVLQHRDD